jgi:hypothetical protein
LDLEPTVTVSDHLDIVAALREVPGVADADVEPDGEGDGLGLLRLGLAPGVDEVEVASAVGRLLRERFGLGVDADRVQLVEDMQADAEDPVIEDDEPQETDRFRPAIRRMHIISSGLQVAAEVTLSISGSAARSAAETSAVGRAEGTATQSGVQRDLVEHTPTGRDRAVLVALTMLSTTGSEKLTGVAGVREDVRQAAIRATLDALNRRVEHMVG